MSIKYGRIERSAIKRTAWQPRGTFRLRVKMCSACLHGEHEYCDNRHRCSCVCREDLQHELALQHANMSFHGLI